MGKNGESLLDMALEFLGGEAPIVCPECSNDSSRITFECPCGTKINLCAPCMLATLHMKGIQKAFGCLDQHRNECEQFAALYEHSCERIGGDP